MTWRSLWENREEEDLVLGHDTGKRGQATREQQTQQKVMGAIISWLRLDLSPAVMWSYGFKINDHVTCFCVFCYCSFLHL